MNAENKYIDVPGKYLVKVRECYLAELREGEEKYHIHTVFEDADGRTISSRQYLGSDKQIGFVEKIFRDVFGFSERDTIDTIVVNINSEKNSVVGRECKITVEENNYVDRQGQPKTGVRVKYINPPKWTNPASDFGSFKAHVRAIRSGMPTAPSKPAPAPATRPTPAPAAPKPPAQAADDFSADAPF